MIESKVLFIVEFIEKESKSYFDNNFEFWAGDDFSIFSDIVHKVTPLENGAFEYTISGSFSQIKSFTRILRQAHKRRKIKLLKEIKSQTTFLGEGKLKRILDSELLEEIKNKLPNQPWEKGIHKKVASELNITNALVSTAIRQFIATGVFKNQKDGIILE